MTLAVIPTVLTPRLMLRPFLAADRDDLAAQIYADPLVMRYLPRRDTPPELRASRAIQYFNEHWQEHGYGAWAITGRLDGRLIGQCGLNYIPETGEVELFYALGQACWGRGLATEAARVAVSFGFETADLATIVAVVVPENISSRRVLEKVGLVYQKNASYFGLEVAYYSIERQSG